MNSCWRPPHMYVHHVPYNITGPGPCLAPIVSVCTFSCAFVLLTLSRRGTPRQPHLVPAARAALRLGPGVPSECLRGLEGFSHCWVLYVFHENTGAGCHGLCKHRLLCHDLIAAGLGSSAPSTPHIAAAWPVQVLSASF